MIDAVTMEFDIPRLRDAVFKKFCQTLFTSVEQMDAGAVLHAAAAPRPAPAPPPAPAPVSEPAPEPAPVAATETQTLQQWLTVYEEILARRPYKAQTLKNHRSNLVHVGKLWGHMPVRSIRPMHVTAALRGAFPAGRESMARRVMDQLRDVMQEAVLNEAADTNPVIASRKPRVKVQRKRMSLEVAQRMLAVAETHRQPWVRPMLLLALATGQRRADLAKARFDDVVDGHLQVEQQKQAGKGYGARVAIPLDLRLDAIGMTVAEVIEVCRTHAPAGPTLLRKHNGKPIELSSLSARFHEVIKTACPGDYADGEWPSLHEARSLSERLYRRQGINTQTLLGHASQEMTDKYNDDRGLTAKEFKRVAVAQAAAPTGDDA